MVYLSCVVTDHLQHTHIISICFDVEFLVTFVTNVLLCSYPSDNLIVSESARISPCIWYTIYVFELIRMILLLYKTLYCGADAFKSSTLGTIRYFVVYQRTIFPLDCPCSNKAIDNFDVIKKPSHPAHTYLIQGQLFRSI